MENYFSSGLRPDSMSGDYSHPLFVEVVKPDFYYVKDDYFSPFGNTEGILAYSALEDYLKKGGKDPLKLLTKYLVKNVGYKMEDIYCDSKDEIIIKHKDHIRTFSLMDQAIPAIVFGFAKITGKLPDELYQIGKIALEREKIITEYNITAKSFDTNKIAKKTNGKKIYPENDESMNNIFQHYLDRIAIMLADLEALKRALDQLNNC